MTGDPSPNPYFGSSISVGGLLQDLFSLAIWAKLTGPRSFFIGVVPDGYFGYHLMPDATGQTYGLVEDSAALVEEGYWTAPAHEIGHAVGKLY